MNNVEVFSESGDFRGVLDLYLSSGQSLGGG